MPGTRLARTYFAFQSVAGAAWWGGVAASPRLREATLGGWDAAWLALFDLVLFVGGSAIAAATGSPRWAWVTAAWTGAVTAALAAYALGAQRAGWGAAAMTVATIGTVAATMTLQWGRIPTRWFFVGPFRFRTATRRTTRAHLAASLAQLVLFWSLFLIAVPMLLRSIEERIGIDIDALDAPVVRLSGIVAFALASCLGLASCLAMAVVGRGTPLPAATANELVVVGPYRFVRNPMAVAGAVQTIGVGWWIGAWTPTVAAVLGALVWHHLIRPAEEADLLARFGEPYERYRSSVRCWIPTAQAWRGEPARPSP